MLFISIIVLLYVQMSKICKTIYIYLRSEISSFVLWKQEQISTNVNLIQLKPT